MVASFDKEEDEYVFTVRISTHYPFTPNHLLKDRTAKGPLSPLVPGHSPEGWYITTSGNIRPSGNIIPDWSTFNYYRIQQRRPKFGLDIFIRRKEIQQFLMNIQTERALGSLISSDPP